MPVVYQRSTYFLGLPDIISPWWIHHLYLVAERHSARKQRKQEIQNEIKQI